MADVLTIEDLHKHFGSGSHIVQANAGITMTVGAGEVVGLLGHNGAGKTTLANQVVGLLRPTSGRIVLDGVDAVANPRPSPHHRPGAGQCPHHGAHSSDGDRPRGAHARRASASDAQARRGADRRP